MKEVKLFAVLIILICITTVWGQEDNCMDCHREAYLMKQVNDSTEISMQVHLDTLENSVHGFFGCTDCHTPVENHPDPDQPMPKANCANCHAFAQEEYDQSIHGKALARGSEVAATCTDCHGSHNIRYSDNPKSKTYAANLPETCGNCHSRPEIIHLFGRRDIDRIKLYEESVHGRLLKAHPDTAVATCNDCHGTHKILPQIDPESKLHVFNIEETCGECHTEAEKDYVKSIHWNSLQRGNYESPTCTDCHGEHQVKAPKTEEGEIDLQASTKICESCHASETMMSRFGLDHRRLQSYFKSYHGLAVLKGSPEAATCTSCHETHAILGKQDTLSTVHESNLVETCGQCHQNVTPKFANIDVHPVDQQSRNPVAFFFRILYTWMIILVIGGMFVHNLIILIHHIREKRKAERYAARYQRFQPFEVYQHMLMFLSFATLVITGFALKFPEAGWVKLLLAVGMDEAARSLIHRIAAVVMVAVSLVQLFYFIFSPKGRRDFKALIPNGDDLLHLWQNLKYHLGFSRELPKFGRYDYTEKAEYLALIWGVIVMGASGFILWFPEFFIGFLPTWLFETAEVIHYYEAWLATLAILIWHWFFVIYHPEKYPMSLTWMDGQITEEELKHHHPLEYEAWQVKKESANKNDESE